MADGVGIPITPISGMTRSEMATAVREMLAEVGSTHITGTAIYNAINRAQRKLNTDSGFNRQSYTLVTSTGVRDYELLGYVEDIYRVTYGSSRTRLEPTSKYELDRDSDGWEAGTAGTPYQYYIDGNYIGFDPKPSVATSVYITYLRTPDDLETHTAVPSWCPTRFHDTICKLAAFDLATSLDRANEENQPVAQRLYADYLEEARQLARLAGNRSREIIPTVTVTGYSSFRRL